MKESKEKHDRRPYTWAMGAYLFPYPKVTADPPMINGAIVPYPKQVPAEI